MSRGILLVAEFVASPNWSYMAGQLIAMSLLPGAGLVLLIAGLVLRRRSAKQQSLGLAGPVSQDDDALGDDSPLHHEDRDTTVARSAHGNRAVSTVMIFVGVVLTLIGGLGLSGSIGRQAQHLSSGVGGSSSTQVLAVGDCVTDKDVQARDMAARPTDCSDRNAVFELASSGGPTAVCPDGKREDSVYSVLMNRSLTYCFILNLREGRCYNAAHTYAISPRLCADPTATMKVARRADGSVEPGVCGVDARPTTYPLPARTYCFVWLRAS